MVKVAGIVLGVNNLGDLSTTFGTCQAILVSVPFVGAGVAIHHLTPRGRVEVTMPFGMRRHLLRLIALIRSQGTQTKANSEAGKAKSSGRQTEGWCKKSFKAMAEVWRNGPSVRVQ